MCDGSDDLIGQGTLETGTSTLRVDALDNSKS